MKLQTMIARVQAAGYHVKPKRDAPGRPKRLDVPRCPCGAMTATRAKKVAHYCNIVLDNQLAD